MAASPAGPDPEDSPFPPGEELTGQPPGRGTAVPEALAAGFTHLDPGHHGTGFAAGGAADVMAPGPALAGLTAQASADDLGQLDDDELAGLLCASRRLASWAAAGEVAAITELARRRTAAGPRAIEHLDDEIAALLILTGRSAARLTGIAASLARLPQTTAALRTGQIDWPRAALIADETCCLSDQDAAAAEDQVLPRAPGQTTGQLRAAIRRAILAIDAAAAIKRRKKAEKDARVEAWTEAAGTSALAGRDLPPAHVIAADRHIDKLARWLKAHGAQGNLDQLRAKVYIALLTGQRPGTLLPPAEASADRSGANPDWPTGLCGSVNLTMPLTTWLGLTTDPGEAAGLGAWTLAYAATSPPLWPRTGAPAGASPSPTQTDKPPPTAVPKPAPEPPTTGHPAPGHPPPGHPPPGHPAPGHLAAMSSPGSPAFPSPAWKQGPAPTRARPPPTGPALHYATSSTSATRPASTRPAGNRQPTATTTTPSPTNKADGPANATSDPDAAATTRPNKPPAGTSTKRDQEFSPGPSPTAASSPGPWAATLPKAERLARPAPARH